MKRKLITALLILVPLLFVFGCSENKNTIPLEGDLYFSVFRFGSFYNQPDSLIENFEIQMDSIDVNNLSRGDSIFYFQYEALKKHDLLYHPYVDLKINNDSIIRLYMEHPDYDKVKIKKYHALRNANERVKINVDASQIYYDADQFFPLLFYCDKLISVEKTSGETFPVERKWRVDDYD